MSMPSHPHFSRRPSHGRKAQGRNEILCIDRAGMLFFSRRTGLLTIHLKNQILMKGLNSCFLHPDEKDDFVGDMMDRQPPDVPLR